MKRMLVFSGVFFLCVLTAGCGSDTHEGLVKDTIARMDLATSNISNIKDEVIKATKAAEAGGTNLDLKKAIEQTAALKETGAEFQKLKARIEHARAQITEENKKAFADSQKGSLTTSYKALIEQKEELRSALGKAEKINDAAKK